MELELSQEDVRGHKHPSRINIRGTGGQVIASNHLREQEYICLKGTHGDESGLFHRHERNDVDELFRSYQLEFRGCHRSSQRLR